MCGSIIPLKSKLYYDEKTYFFNLPFYDHYLKLFIFNWKRRTK